MSLPQVNATLTAVATATAATGGRDDWDAPGTPAVNEGQEKWTGAADAYYRETVRRNLADGATVLSARTLIVESSVARAAGIDTDDVLTFTRPDGSSTVTETARAAVVAIRELAGIPTELQTARLELEET